MEPFALCASVCGTCALARTSLPKRQHKNREPTCNRWPYHGQTRRIVTWRTWLREFVVMIFKILLARTSNLKIKFQYSDDAVIAMTSFLTFKFVGHCFYAIRYVRYHIDFEIDFFFKLSHLFIYHRLITKDHEQRLSTTHSSRRASCSPIHLHEIGTLLTKVIPSKPWPCHAPHALPHSTHPIVFHPTD